MADELGYYPLPVILSFDGIDKQVNKSLGGVLGKAGVSASKDFAKSFGSASANDLKRAFENQAKLADKAADATGKLKVAQAAYQELVDKGIQSGARYERAKANAEKATRDETRATRSATDALKDYEQARKSLESGSSSASSLGSGLFDKLKGAAGAAKSSGSEAAAGFVDGFGGPIATLGTKAGPLGLALAAGAGLGLAAGGLLAKNVLAGMDQLQSQANVAAKLGLTAEQIKPIADASAKAYASNFGESVADNMDTARAAIQSGLIANNADPKAIQDIVQQLDTVAAVTGEEIPAAARAAQQAIRTGLAPNATAAFDLITKAQQNGLNVSDDLLDTITEYGTQFRKLGLDGPQAFGLIQQAVKGGARDTDVAADALKEFSIRIIDGSEATGGALQKLGLDFNQLPQEFAAGGDRARKAFQLVIDKINGIQDPVEKASLQVALFGTQSEDLGDALNHMNLDTAVQEFGRVEGATKRAGDTMSNTAAGSFETAKRSIETSMSGVQQALARAFGPDLAKLADWVTKNQDQIIGGFAQLGDVALQAGQLAGQGIGVILQGIGSLVAPLGDVLGAVNKFQAWQADMRGDHAAADELRKQADEFFGWGEGLSKLGTSLANLNVDSARDSLKSVAEQAKNAKENTDLLATGITTLPDGKVVLKDSSPESIQRVKDLGYAITNLPNGQVAIAVQYMLDGRPISRDQLVTPIRVAATPGGAVPSIGGGRAKGGVLPGYSPGVDNMLVPMSGGEGVLIPQAVRALGPGFVHGINDMFRGGYANGGIIGGQDVQAAMSFLGTKYSQGNRTDCSGMVARVINRAMGLPDEGLMSTKNAAEWLKARGFVPGVGGPGTISVGWYDHGPNPNDGHMAMTLSDGTNAEAGGKNSVFTIGAGAQGADSPQFDQHMYLPQLFGEGPGGMSGAAMSGSYSAAGGGVPGYGPNGEPGTYSAPSAKDIREANQRVADADQRVKEAEAKQRELEADAKESQKISAQADVDKAKREAQDARDDLAEVQKGKFSPGSPSSGKSGGQKGLGQFGALGDIAGSFLKETFGLDGSFFPDISSLAPVQMANTLLSAFSGPLQGLMDGQLGIQQPGWQPGMPVNGVLNDTGIGDTAQTSASAFGMPDTSAPPMPTGNAHTGTGAAPGPTITNDMSVTYQGNVGMDPDTLAKQQRRNQDRGVARLTSFGAGLT